MTEQRLQELLQPFAGSPPSMPLPQDFYAKLGAYLELLLRWNARTNLTAVRAPEEIVTRHFGESVFAALQLAPFLGGDATLLDFGSGAGFPGLPIQLAIPAARVTLAESQGKKAAFLREAVRVVGVRADVWSGRVEAMSAAHRFDVVALRAVDRMEGAIVAAADRVRPGGILAELGSKMDDAAGRQVSTSMRQVGPAIPIPASERRVLRLWRSLPA